VRFAQKVSSAGSLRQDCLVQPIVATNRAASSLFAFLRPSAFEQDDRVFCRVLSSLDAQIAEAFARECEDQARAASLGGLQFRRSTIVQNPARPVPNSAGRRSPKHVILCRD
jgi:hypothetical protein